MAIKCLFNHHIELVIRCSSVGEVLGGRGEAEEGGVGPDLDGLAIGHELKDPEPAVSTVAFPAASEGLRVEEHLADGLSGFVGVGAPAHGEGIVILAGLAEIAVGMVAAENQPYVRDFVDEFLPYGLAVVV